MKLKISLGLLLGSLIVLGALDVAGLVIGADVRVLALKIANAALSVLSLSEEDVQL